MITEEKNTLEYVIQLFPIRHRNALQWALLAPYDPLLKDLLKSTQLVKWSQSKRLWYMPYSDSHIFKLQKALEGTAKLTWKKEMNHQAYHESFHYFSFDDFRQRFQNAPSLKHQVLLFLSYVTGFDLDGLSKLLISHRREDHLLMVKVSIGRPLVLPLSEFGNKLLEEYLNVYQPKKYFFETEQEQMLTVHQINNLLQEALSYNRYTSKNISASFLRHSLLQHLLDRGVPSNTILMFLGRSSTVVWEDLLLINKLEELQEQLFIHYESI